MNRLKKVSSKSDIGAAFLATLVLALPLEGCGTAARSEKMIPASFQTSNTHPRTVRVNVTGGQDDISLGKPQITNGAFKDAVAYSIIRSRAFSSVLDNPNAGSDFLLTIDLLGKDTRVVADTLKLEAVWTLQRGDNSAIVWRETIVSEAPGGISREATENAARNNIEQALAKISKLDLRPTADY